MMPGNRADKAAAPEANEQDEKPSQAPRQSKHAHEDAAEAFSEQAASIQSTQGTQNLEHPRAGMSGWRWALIVASIYLTNLISGEPRTVQINLLLALSLRLSLPLLWGERARAKDIHHLVQT